MGKENILITWENGYIFEDICFELFEKLFDVYNIYIVIIDFKFSTNQKKKLINDKRLKYLKIIPYECKTREKLTKYKEVLEELKHIDFYTFISDSFVKEIDYLLIHKIDSINSSIKVLFHPHISNVFLEYEKNSYLIDKENIDLIKYKNNRLNSIKKEVIHKKIFFYLKYIFLKNVNKIDSLFLRFLFKKQFSLDLAENTSKFRIGTHVKIDKMILLDEFEATTFSKIFKDSKIYVVDKCDFNQINSNLNSKKALLFESGFERFSIIPKQVLDDYISDIKQLMKIYDLKSLDIKPHPRNKKPSLTLQKYLLASDISSSILNETNRLKDIVKNYSCCMSNVSASLRFCSLISNINAVCFEKTSQYFFYNPFIVLGKGNNIKWFTIDNKIHNANPYIIKCNGFAIKGFLEIIKD